MNELQARAQAFERLLHIEYRMILGRKGKTVEIILRFDAENFHHLAGLHKLSTLRISRARRQTVFRDVLQGKVAYTDLEKSPSFDKISKRLYYLLYLEELLDSNELIFRYNPKVDAMSLMVADYLLISPKDSDEIYIFISKDERTGVFYCRSFFPKTGKDYTRGQVKFTLLYKEKTNLSTGETVVQYDKLTSKIQ